MKKKPMWLATVRLVVVIVAFTLVVFGAHGIYAYANRLETVFSLLGGVGNKLFFTVDMPGMLGDITSKVTIWGIQSIIMPALILVAGVLLFAKRGRIAWRIIGWLR